MGVRKHPRLKFREIGPCQLKFHMPHPQPRQSAVLGEMAKTKVCASSKVCEALTHTHGDLSDSERFALRANLAMMD